MNDGTATLETPGVTAPGAPAEGGSAVLPPVEATSSTPVDLATSPEATSAVRADQLPVAGAESSSISLEQSSVSAPTELGDSSVNPGLVLGYEGAAEPPPAPVESAAVDSTTTISVEPAVESDLDPKPEGDIAPAVNVAVTDISTQQAEGGSEDSVTPAEAAVVTPDPVVLAESQPTPATAEGSADPIAANEVTPSPVENNWGASNTVLPQAPAGSTSSAHAILRRIGLGKFLGGGSSAPASSMESSDAVPAASSAVPDPVNS